MIKKTYHCIQKIYRCDLCHGDIKNPPDSATRPGMRVKFFAKEVIQLCDLEDNSASEAAICGPCLNGLSKAIAKVKP